MGITFTSLCMREHCRLIEVNPDDATVEHTQTIRSLELTHAFLTQCSCIYESQIKRDWHN